MSSKKPIYTITNGVLTFTKAGDYTLDYLPSGQIKIKLDGGHAAVLSASEYSSVTKFAFAPGAVLESAVAVSGITFREADATGGFEVSRDLNDLVGTMINQHGVAWTVENLLVNGSQTDTFKVVWDYLDDAYVAGNNYYNLPLNESFARLGVEYADYLAQGGGASDRHHGEIHC